jgi:hypothetical protein
MTPRTTRRARRAAAPALAALGLLAAGCFARTTDITLYRSQLPARPQNCDVSILPRPKPDYPVEDLGRISIDFTPGGRDAAMNRLRRETCYYGGDTLYAIEEAPQNAGLSKLSATLARRPPGSAPPPSAPPGAPTGYPTGAPTGYPTGTPPGAPPSAPPGAPTGYPSGPQR